MTDETKPLGEKLDTGSTGIPQKTAVEMIKAAAAKAAQQNPQAATRNTI